MSFEIRNITFGEGKPKIAIPLCGKNLNEVSDEIHSLEGLAYDLVEWRIDYYENIENVRNDIQKVRHLLVDTPLLITCRTINEGGNQNITIDSYQNLYQNLIDTNCVDLIDVEALMPEENVKSIIEYAHDNHVKIILSSHDFTCTPSYKVLMKRLEYMKGLHADMCKIAVMPRNKDDVVTLLNVTYDAERILQTPLCTISMGELGILSRFSGEIYGSCMTFGCNENASAPGQIYANKLNAILDLIHSNH